MPARLLGHGTLASRGHVAGADDFHIRSMHKFYIFSEQHVLSGWVPDVNHAFHPTRLAQRTADIATKVFWYERLPRIALRGSLFIAEVCRKSVSPPNDTQVPGGFPRSIMRFIQQDSHNELPTLQQKCFAMNGRHYTEPYIINESTLSTLLHVTITDKLL